MNFLANLLKILIILVLFAVAACIVLMGAMVLFPSFSIFGIHYVTGDSKSIIYYYNVEHEKNIDEWASVDTFYIETDGWDVYVYSNVGVKDAHTENGIDIRVNRNYAGFASNSVGEAVLSKYEFKKNKDGNYLSVKMTEPTGWLSKFDTSLYVYLDDDTLVDKTLSIKTNGGKVVLGESLSKGNPINVNKVIVNSGGNNAYVQNINIADSLTINKASGDINIYKNLKCDANLSITNSWGNINLNNIGTESDKKSLIIEHIHNAGVNFGTIYGDLLVNGNMGTVKGKTVTDTVVVDAENCSMTLEESKEDLFFNNKNGSLSVNKANVVIAGVTDRGSVSIKELFGNSLINTYHGNVTVEKVYTDISVGTVNGNIDLTNAKDANVNFLIESTNGYANIKNIRGSLKFNTNDKGNASIDASFWELKGENVINTFSGKINIDMLDAGYGFMLKDWYTTNTVFIKLSRFEEFEIKDSLGNDDYKFGVKIGGYSGSTDTLSVTTNVGALRVVHPELV